MTTLGLILTTLFATVAPTAPGATPPQTKEEAKWRLRLPAEDRSAVDLNLGHALPRFKDDIVWVGTSPFGAEGTPEDRVVIVQSWTHGNSRGRTIPRKLETALKPIGGSDELVVVLLHTPEDADEANRFLERNGSRYPVAIDPSGGTCDAMGVYRRPVNLVVDRQGVIRYAGLHDRGLVQAVEKLLAESHDPEVEATPHPADAVPDSTPTGEFPAITGTIGAARDLRGEPAPTFAVEQWLTPEPSAQGKVAVIDFWATWCGPCIRSIPHMNQLADQFRDRVEFVGISNESLTDFNRGLSKRNLTPRSFRYSLALDTQGRMMSAFGVRGIPHVAVISSDWVVRWQGMPSGLTSDVLGRIVDANGGSGVANTGGPPARWSRAAK